MTVLVGRVYDASQPHAGRRVLVDRLWPRGMTKERAALDEWVRGAAPSNELRRWYAHDPDRFAEFDLCYRSGFRDGAQADALRHLRDLAASGPLLLLTAAKDPSLSEAAVLAELLDG